MLTKTKEIDIMISLCNTTIGKQMNDTEKVHRKTTFQLSNALHTELRMMCILTNKSMGDFIRIAIMDLIRKTKSQDVK